MDGRAITANALRSAIPALMATLSVLCPAASTIRTRQSRNVYPTNQRGIPQAAAVCWLIVYFFSLQ